MVDFVKEMIAEKSCKDGEHRSYVTIHHEMSRNVPSLLLQ